MRHWWNMIDIKCVEPVKRNKDGLRWISHRFPIKGGISWREAMIQDMSQPNPWLKALSNGLNTPTRKWLKLNANS